MEQIFVFSFSADPSSDFCCTNESKQTESSLVETLSYADGTL